VQAIRHTLCDRVCLDLGRVSRLRDLDVSSFRRVIRLARDRAAPLDDVRELVHKELIAQTDVV
jgi:hypothetical protein